MWSVEMHQQFVNAVNTLGVDSAPLALSRTLALDAAILQTLPCQRVTVAKL